MYLSMYPCKSGEPGSGDETLPPDEAIYTYIHMCICIYLSIYPCISGEPGAGDMRLFLPTRRGCDSFGTPWPIG